MQVPPLFDDLEDLSDGPLLAPALAEVGGSVVGVVGTVVTLRINYEWSFLDESDHDDSRFKEVFGNEAILCAQPDQWLEFAGAGVIDWHPVLRQGAVPLEHGHQIHEVAKQVDLVVDYCWLLGVFLLKHECFHHFFRTYNRLEHNILIFLFSTPDPSILHHQLSTNSYAPNFYFPFYVF